MLQRTLRSASFALALAALVLAGPARAGGHKWGHHEGHHYGHHHHHHDGWEDDDYYAPRYVEHRVYAYPVYHYVEAPAYYRGPCGEHFDSYDDLSYHVQHHHHPVAVLELPSVIFRASIGGGVGWVFGD